MDAESSASVSGAVVTLALAPARLGAGHPRSERILDLVRRFRSFRRRAFREWVNMFTLRLRAANSIADVTLEQLRRAVQLKEQIEPWSVNSLEFRASAPMRRKLQKSDTKGQRQCVREIDRALRTRFGNPIHLNDYKVPEVAEMLRVKKAEWAAWPGVIRSGLAQLSRCIPREAERLAQKLERKLNVSRERLTLDSALEKLRLEEGLDRNGLDQVCWDTLRLLAKQPRPLGKETLAQRLGVVDEDKLVSEVIPGLQTLGLVEQVPGGQIITDRGRNYLRNEAAPTTG